MTGVHPLLLQRRPVITTPPILLLGNVIRAAMEDGHQGMKAEGSARAGKTFALRWLMQRNGWHTEPLARISVRVPRHTKVTDSYLFQLILMCCRQVLASRLPPLETLGRVRDLLEQVCRLNNATTVLLLIDEAQRLHADEIADFLTIVNESEAWDINVFVVFVHQTDVTGQEAESIRTEFSPHIKGRFGLARHHIYGLRGEIEIAKVLERFDNNAKWPIGGDITYTQHFAPAAYANDDFRLAKHTNEIIDIVNELRATRGLGSMEEWPMKTFELFVQRTLTRIVTRPGFHDLTRDDIREALDASGYIALELCRAHMKDDDED